MNENNIDYRAMIASEAIKTAYLMMDDAYIEVGAMTPANIAKVAVMIADAVLSELLRTVN